MSKLFARQTVSPPPLVSGSTDTKRRAQVVINALPSCALVHMDTDSGNTYIFSIIDGARGEAAVFNTRQQQLLRCRIVGSTNTEGEFFSYIIRADCELCLSYDDPEVKQEMTRVADVFRLEDSPEGARMIEQLERKIESAPVRTKAMFIEQCLEQLQNECGTAKCCEDLYRLVGEAPFPDGQLKLLSFLEQAREYRILPAVIANMSAEYEQHMFEQQQQFAPQHDTSPISPFFRFDKGWNPAVIVRPSENPTVIGADPPVFANVK